jgi:recombination protein RecA
MPNKLYIDEAIQKLYVEDHLTDLEIAQKLGCHKSTVYQKRKKLGIKAIKRWERNNCQPTSEQLQIILGSLLGDGSVSNGKKGDYICQSQFAVSHGPKQKPYLFWKYKKLSDLCSSEPKELADGKWRFRSFHHPFFSELRKKWYPRGKKILNISLLESITPLGLAVWYMDDGSLIKSGNFMKISTCCFTESEHRILVDWLKQKFDIRSHTKVYSGYRVLVIDLDDRKKFVKLVRKFITPEMKYKITFREYHTWKN